jgi:hypothetical protein
MWAIDLAIDCSGKVWDTIAMEAILLRMLQRFPPLGLFPIPGSTKVIVSKNWT